MNRIEHAEGFAKVWQQGKYKGFSSGTENQRTTPLLDALVERLTPLNGTKSHIVEGGAGSGDHSITLARNGFQVTAVEYSETAARSLQERKRGLPCTYRDDLSVVQGDVLQYLNQRHEISAFYANSVLHFFTPEDRTKVYTSLNNSQSRLIAVSFKAEGDSLQSRGDVVKRTSAGDLVKSQEDGISRLFVTDPTSLVRELSDTGYQVGERDIYRWNVNDYNHQGEPGKFVGLLAVRGESK